MHTRKHAYFTIPFMHRYRTYSEH